MSILRNAVRELRDYNFNFLQWQDVTGAATGFGISDAGINVTQDTAMTCSAVYAAISIISETIATLPVHVYQRYGDGSRYERPNPLWMDHPIYGELNWISFCQQVVTSLLLDGNAFIGVVRDPRDGVTPIALWPLAPRAVQVIREPSTLVKQYIISTVGNTRVFTGDQILHIMGITMPGMLRGVSPIERAKQSIGRTLAAGQLASSLFANGAVPGAVITSPLKLTPEQAKDIQSRYDASHKGTLQAFKTVVLGADAKVNQISLTPEQVQMIDVMKFGVIDVARWYRVPPHLLGDVERSTSWGTGIAEQNSMFVIHTLTPWIVRLEAALQRLVTDTFPGLDIYPKIEVKGLMRGNPKDEAEYLEKKLQAQAATPNDWRRLDDENPLPDGNKVLKSVQWQPDAPAAQAGTGVVPADTGAVNEPAL